MKFCFDPLQLLSFWKVTPFTELLQQFVYFSKDYHLEYSYKHVFRVQIKFAMGRLAKSALLFLYSMFYAFNPYNGLF